MRDASGDIQREKGRQINRPYETEIRRFLEEVL